MLPALNSSLYTLANALLIVAAAEAVIFQPLPHAIIKLLLIAVMGWGLDRGRKAGLW